MKVKRLNSAANLISVQEAYSPQMNQYQSPIVQRVKKLASQQEYNTSNTTQNLLNYSIFQKKEQIEKQQNQNIINSNRIPLPIPRPQSAKVFNSVQSQPSILKETLGRSQILQNSTCLTNQSLSNIQMLQRKLLISDNIAQIPIEILEQLFLIRCKDMKLKVIKEQLYRFLNKIQIQCSQGSLNLSNLSLTKNCLELISEIVINAEVSTLVLNQNNIQNTKCLAERLNYMQLVSLGLQNCNLDFDGLNYLFDELKFNYTVVHLDLGNPSSNFRNRIGVQAAISLNNLLLNNQFISVLSLKACGLTEKMLEILNESFKKNRTLIHLDLSENELISINEKLVIPPKLEWLEIHGNRIGNQGIQLIAQQLRPQGNAIEINYLNLGENKITLDGLAQVFEYIERNVYLQKLVIDNNMLSGDSTKFISIFLSSNNTLQELSLKNCSITTPVISSISYGLSRNMRIQRINLSRNPISDQGALMLKDMFNSTTSSISYLKLKRCSMTDVGAKPLFIALLRQSNLQYLDFSQNMITDQAALVVLKLVKQNKNVTEFKLNKNMVSFHLHHEIMNILKDNLEQSKQKLVPNLLSQIGRISDLSNQQEKLEENQLYVMKRKEKSFNDYNQFVETFSTQIEQAREKTKFVEDKLQNIRSEAYKINQQEAKISSENWSNIQKLEDEINNLRGNIRSENQKSAVISKQVIELQQEVKDLQIFYKQRTDQYKMQVDIQNRKYKIALAEFEGFQKNLNEIQSKQDTIVSPKMKSSTKKEATGKKKSIIQSKGKKK